MTADPDLSAAVADIEEFSSGGFVWKRDDIEECLWCGKPAESIATILNAVASGALVPVETVQGLVDALAAIAGLGTKSGHAFARLYPDLNKKLDDAIHEHWAAILSEHADAALTAWENRK